MTDTPADQNNPLIDATLCLVIRFKRPGLTRSLREDQYEVKASKTLVRASKKLLDADEYRKIANFEGNVKAFLRLQALPSKLYRLGTFLIPSTKALQVDEFLESAREEWKKLVDELIEVYPERKAETLKELGDVANPADYWTPEQLRDLFSFHFEYVTLSTPTKLAEVNPKLYEREAKRFQERLEGEREAIIGAFREQMLRLSLAMKAMLDGEESKPGKTMIFTGKRIRSLQEFMAQFLEQDNVCGDEELPVLMKQVGDMLGGVDPKALKKDEAWRKSMSSTFGDVIGKLEGMTKVRGKRLIEDEGDDD